MNEIVLNGIVWYKYHGALIPKTSPHTEVILSKEDKKYLLGVSNAYFLRYTTDWDSKEESDFWYIIKDIEENLEDYSSKKRSQIRRGLKNCSVEKVSNEEIAENGYEVYIKAFDNYTTNLIPLSKEEFYNNTINAIGYDYFAVYTKDEGGRKMIAYSNNIIKNNQVDYVTIKFHPDYLKLYSSYALFFEMNKYYLNNCKNLYVNDGARSISHDTNIQDYLIQKFNFRRAYCRLNIIYRWDVGLAVKLLYPFRGVINKFNHKIFNKISVLLKQEEIRKNNVPL